jgi:hypothetical protein
MCLISWTLRSGSEQLAPARNPLLVECYFLDLSIAPVDGGGHGHGHVHRHGNRHLRRYGQWTRTRTQAARKQTKLRLSHISPTILALGQLLNYVSAAN